MRVAQVLLARVESLSNRQNVKESTVTGLGVATGHRASFVVRREIEGLPAEISELRDLGANALQDVTELGVGGDDLDSVREAFAGYQKVLTTQLGLLETDEFTQAFAFDRFRVDAAYVSLQEALEAANGRLNVQAQRAGSVADLGAFSVVIAALLGLGFLQKRALRTREFFEKELEHQAFHDALTGLPNRTLFRDRAQQALARSRRTGEPVALLLADLNGFKSINDRLGHSMGDRVLAAVAARLVECTRAPDTVARLGGDEFAILLEDLGPSDDAAEIAQRLIEGMASPLDMAGRSVSVGMSVGVAVGSSGDDVGFDDLLANADMAMYSAKLKRDGGLEVFGHSMRLAMTERLGIEADLKHAIENDELVLHYQPIVELESGRTRGVEALVRWNRPGEGLLHPGQFIPVAESTGLIVPLGRWVLGRATRQLKQWHEEHPGDPPLRMSVNLSAEEFECADLVANVAEVLEDSGVDPGCLVLEIVETALMRDTDATVEMLRGLKALGVLLAVDDFGTGYSSLNYLRRFPIDRLKIDRSFVANGAQDEPLVQAIVRLAGGLGLETVAEGIEDSDQLSQLRSLGCEFGQGFLFAKPLAPEDMGLYLASPFRPVATGRPELLTGKVG